jgi:DNA-binding transcriptional LysR family regulator
MRAAYAFEDMQDPGTDLAFRVVNVNDDRLVARKVGAFPFWLVAAPEFAAAHPVAVPSDLARVPCLTFEGDRPGSTWTFGEGAAATPVDVTGPIAVQHFGILLDLAAEGQGYAFLPSFMLTDALAQRRVVRALPDLTSPRFPVYLTFRPGARRIARINATIELAETYVPQLLAL